MMQPSTRRLLASVALVAVAAVWGGTFVMVKLAVAAYPVWAFLGWRFSIAAVAAVLLMPGSLRMMDAKTVLAGLLAGVFLTAGYAFQTWGLTLTSPSKAALITGMFVVITPFMQAALLRRMPSWPAWTGVVAATVGLFLLTGGAGGSWNTGDTLVLLCATSYSAHMIVLGSVGRRYDARAITVVQLAMTGVVCGAVSLATENAGLPGSGSVWTALVLTGVLASAIAFVIQTYAQRVLSPARTALILISEPAFGAVSGAVWAGERLGARGWTGAFLIIAGMAVSELLVALRAKSGERRALETGLEGPPAAVVEATEGD